MFFSLNKKFFVTIITFLLFCSGIFLIIFDNTIGKKITSEHDNIISRNQYVIELLNENISLRKKISYFQPEKPLQLSNKQDELSREQKLNEELIKTYNDDYSALLESLTILGLGASLTLISLIVLWLLLRHWVITPIDKLTEVSIGVANGDFSKRIKIKKSHFTDEFNTLMQTINFMLDNIETNINSIKEKEIFLQNLIDAMPDAIRVIDNNHNIILSNKAHSDLIKKKYFYNSNKCYTSYSKENKCPCTKEHLCPLEELKKSSSSSVKLIHIVNDHPLSINSARITLNNEIGIVESIRDLSDNINYSHQQKISSLGFLASSLAHEIKNNLGAINIILDGVLQKYYSSDSKEEEKKYLEMISTQIKECIKVPERLLKISSSNEQTNTIFPITSSINDVLSLLDYEIKSKGITLIKNFSNTKENISGNETDFKMILLNLIQNSINAMPKGGNLEIKTNTNKDAVLIDIKDNGCGIKEEDLKHIFEPFYSTSKNKTGTGLGLAIVKDLIQKLNAKITVSSTYNIGTSFQITIPRQKHKKLL
ncbi:MAG: ATP-binding protein [Alphaproteobacteria bacterium]|nr:ATP-binding protein [Alphaproteobacteria bacterium]